MGGGKANRCPDRAAPWYNENVEGKVLTPWGFKLIGDIKPGDQVCNPDGTVARVIACHDRGPQQFYRVTLADGSYVETSADHLWAASIAGVRKRRKTDVPVVANTLRPEDEWNLRVQQRTSIVTTEQLASLVERAEQDKAGGKRARHVQIPLSAPVALSAPKGRWQTLPPYTLGVLVGDGTIGTRDIRFTTADVEVVERVNAELPEGISAKIRERHANCNAYAITGAVGIKTDSVQKLLDRDGLAGKRSWEKFVPDRIKLGSVETRTAFVQGLFDADGYMDERGHVEFVTVSERLAEDVQWLLRSLGCTAKLATKQPHYTHKGERRTGRLAYRLYVRGATLGMLFGMVRKSSRAKPFNGGDVWPSHRIVAVEKTEVDNARCITVDNPNGLYVTDDFIVTHNSDALLMAALMFADVPGYKALILRRTFPELTQPDSLIPRSQEWLGPTQAKWSEQKHEWTFPSGASLRFGYMQHTKDKHQYQGGAYQYIGFDELTGFEEEQYVYMLSRLRRLVSSPTPLRMRSASNPGNVGHEWVYERFVVGEHPFVPASLDDNPFLSGEEYKENLRELDDVTRAQLLEGKWITDPHGKPYKREWWRARENRYDSTDPTHERACVARWLSVDTAMKAKDDSDYTAICVFELGPDWRIYLRHVYQERLEFPELPGVIEDMAMRWDYDLKLREIVIEDKAHGTAAIQTLRATASPAAAERLIAFNPTQDKLQRARQAGVWAKRGCVALPQPSPAVPWLTDFERQLFNFPDTTHDDMVDAFSQGIIYYEHYAAEGWRARGMAA